MVTFIKRNIAVITGAVATALTLAGTVGATGTYVDVPLTAVADLTGYAGTLFTDLWVVIALAVGIPLAFYVIRKVIGLMPKR